MWINVLPHLQFCFPLVTPVPFLIKCLKTVLGANYTSRPSSVSESTSVSEYSADRKAPIGFYVNS